MRGLAVLLVGMSFVLTGCVVYDDDYGHRGGRGYWDDHREGHWEGRHHDERWDERRRDDRDDRYYRDR